MIAAATATVAAKALNSETTLSTTTLPTTTSRNIAFYIATSVIKRAMRELSTFNAIADASVCTSSFACILATTICDVTVFF